MTTPNPAPTIIAWTTSADDPSPQFYVRVSAAISAQIGILRSAPLSTDPVELHQQATALQQLLPRKLSTWVPDDLPSQELVTRLRAERDTARAECDEHMTGEGRLQQRLADAELIMNRLARITEPSEPRDRAEKIADCNGAGF